MKIALAALGVFLIALTQAYEGAKSVNQEEYKLLNQGVAKKIWANSLVLLLFNEILKALLYEISKFFLVLQIVPTKSKFLFCTN